MSLMLRTLGNNHEGPEIKDFLKYFFGPVIKSLLYQTLTAQPKNIVTIDNIAKYDDKITEDAINNLLQQGYKQIYFGNSKPKEYFDEQGNLRPGFDMVEFKIGTDTFRKIFEESKLSSERVSMITIERKKIELSQQGYEHLGVYKKNPNFIYLDDKKTVKPEIIILEDEYGNIHILCENQETKEMLKKGYKSIGIFEYIPNEYINPEIKELKDGYIATNVPYTNLKHIFQI